MSYLEKLMLLFQLLILLLNFKCQQIPVSLSADDQQEKSNANDGNRYLNLSWSCTQMDEASINFKFIYNESIWQLTEYLLINYQYTECNKCDLINLLNLTFNTNYTSNSIIDSYYKYKMQVITSFDQIICDFNNKPLEFNECGNYLFEINGFTKECSINLINKLPFNSNNYLYIASVLSILLIFFYNLIFYLYSKYKNNNNAAKVRNSKKADKADTNQSNQNSTNEMSNLADTVITSYITPPGDIKNLNKKIENAAKPVDEKKKRLQSLDTLRGISLVIMIFVNYGSGGYKSLQHKPWHGITIADFVFPWFLWIMGVSMSISTNTLLQKQKKTKIEVILKIIIRFAKLFFIGIMLNSRFGVRLSELRIFGVLQRIAICYLVVAILEVLLYNRNIDEYINCTHKYKRYFVDLLWSWKQWLATLLILSVWFFLTYLLPVPGCPTGYVGPGGLDNHGKYYNCTGGAAGYIDTKIIGNAHLYNRPTPKKIYQTNQPFDPEGILGIFNSVVLTYLGVQAGRVLVFHKNETVRIVLWSIWSLITFLLFAILTFFDLENGPIPVNKNLWTLTFSLITASSGFFLLVVLYVVIDLKKLWNGAPIIYPGMNSIIIYVCHSVFSSTFPIQWIVANTHAAKLFMTLWGAIAWTIVATYLYYQNIFFNL